MDDFIKNIKNEYNKQIFIFLQNPDSESGKKAFKEAQKCLRFFHNKKKIKGLNHG